MVHRKREFKVLLERDEDGFYVATVPALPGCHTQARTLPVLRTRIREAISLCLEVASSDPGYRARIEKFSYSPTRHSSEDIGRGLLRRILREIQIPPGEFEKLL